MKIERPIIALDFPNAETAYRFLDRFPKDEHLFVKIGMELFYSEGRTVVERVIGRGHDVFLDLKCHDIPHTVASAMRVIGQMGVALTTLHASGGREMMLAAKEGLLDGAGGNNVPQLLAITQLTSTDENMVANEQLVRVNLQESVRNYARLAQNSGMDGVVCSAQEAAMIMEATAPEFMRITPGIRMVGNDHGDQKRVMTPDQAAAQHSSGIVVGRAITQAADPVAAYRQVMRLWRGERE